MHQWRLRVIHRETVVLLVLVLIAVVAFAVTRTLARKSRELRLGDAASLHQRALRELDAGHPEAASATLRRAVATDPEHHRYPLDLARALADTRRDGQARQVLLRLRERTPEDADVNLALARLEARGPDEAAAVRYYQHALAALWSDGDIDRRRTIRLEMAEFLLRHGQRRRALAELLVLSPALPDDVALRGKVGRMFLDVGDPHRALEQFTAVLRAAPRDEHALAGAGEAAFELGDYVRARRYLALAPGSLPALAELRTITNLVLTRDPLVRRIGRAERRRRLVANLDDISQRLSACAGQLATRGRTLGADLDQLRSELDVFRLTLRRRRPVAHDFAEDGLDLMVRIEQAMGDVCGPPTPFDRAMLLIARRHDIGTS